MLQIIIGWIYITVIAYSLGFSVLRLPAAFGSRVKLERFFLPTILTGLMVMNVYAEYVSLFTGVGMWPVIIMTVIALLLLFLQGKTVRTSLVDITSRMKLWKWLSLSVLVILMSYGTSRGYMHFDTNLYHAQAIRWIEEYGVVPGLANLEQRFGYNSAEFALNALLSFKWLTGQSLHICAGYFAFVSALLAGRLFEVFVPQNGENGRSIEIKLSSFLRIGLIYYLCVIFGEMMSPASDYFAQLLIFDILILWLDGEDDIEDEDRLIGYKTMLCVLLVYAITIKLSIGLLVFIAVAPAVSLIRKKNYRGIIFGLTGGLLVAIPYFIRNVIISGWLLYPSTAIDLFNVDWKVPKVDAQFDANEIGVYGKGITDMTHWNDPVSAWVGNWFINLKSLEKVWIMLTVISLIMGLVIALCALLKKRSRQGLTFTLLFGVISVSTLFWFFSAPLVRYGYAYVIICPMLVLGYVALLIRNRLFVTVNHEYRRGWNISGVLFLIVLSLFMCLKLYDIIEIVGVSVKQSYYIKQIDYIDGEAESVVIDGQEIYTAIDRGQIGYYKFPATSLVHDDLRLRGSELRDGFTRTR